MKMSPSAFAHVKAEIEKLLAEHNANNALVERYERGDFPRAECVKNLQMRFCFDLFYAAKLSKYASDVLYPAGLNDDHIYTALKAICPKVEDKRVAV